MSKRCDDQPNDSVCQRESSQSRSKSGTRQSSLKRKKHSRRSKKSFHSRTPSSRNSEKSKRSQRAKKCPACSSEKSSLTCIEPITNKTRAEHFTEYESTANESTTNESSASRLKKYDRKSERKRAKKNKKQKKKKEKKIKEKKKHSKSSTTSSRLIVLLFKWCSCLKSLDPSSSSFPYNDTSCCHRCNCRFCRPVCDNKSIQCDDCDHFVGAAAVSRRGSSDLSSDSVNKIASRLTKEEDEKSRQCVTHENSKTACEKRINDFRSDSCQGEQEGASNVRSHYRNQRNKSDSCIKVSIKKNLTSKRRTKTRQSSTKSFIDERDILKNCILVESRNGSTGRYGESASIPSPEKLSEFGEKKTDGALKRVCDNDECGKTMKALRIMCDIVFWPYTCLPGKRSCDDRNNIKKSNEYEQREFFFVLR